MPEKSRPIERWERMNIRQRQAEGRKFEKAT